MSSYGFTPPRPPDRGAYRRPRTRRPRPVGPLRPPDRGPLTTPRAPSPVAAAAGARPVPVPPNYSQQALSQTQQQLDPMLQYIAQHYGNQAAGVSGALTDLTGQYASALAGIAGQTAGIYGPSIKTVSGAAQGINAQLTSLGKAAAGAEATSAAQAGQAVGGQSPDINLAAAGSGAGGAAGAIGDAAIQALTSAQKAAMTYAGQLPGFAKLEGDQHLHSALSQLAAEMADQLAQTTAQAPTLYWSIYQQLQDRAQHDKEFAFQVRQYNQGRADQRAGIKSPKAPTVAGRTAYWQDVANQRSQDTGDVWVATPTGIRPYDADPRRPGIQRQRTQQGIGADYTLHKPIRYQGADGRTRLFDPGTGTTQVLPGPAKPQKQTAPPKANVPLSRAIGRWVDANGNPIPTLGGAKPPPPLVKGQQAKGPKPIFGTAPHKDAQGVWVGRNGKPLSPAGQKYWANLLARGLTDGAGHITKPDKKQAGGGRASSGGKPPGLSP